MGTAGNSMTQLSKQISFLFDQSKFLNYKGKWRGVCPLSNPVLMQLQDHLFPLYCTFTEL